MACWIDASAWKIFWFCSFSSVISPWIFASLAWSGWVAGGFGVAMLVDSLVVFLFSCFCCFGLVPGGLGLGVWLGFGSGSGFGFGFGFRICLVVIAA